MKLTYYCPHCKKHQFDDQQCNKCGAQMDWIGGSKCDTKIPKFTLMESIGLEKK